MNFKTLTLAAALAAAFAPAQAQVSDNVVRIGVLTDLSGAYSDIAGKGAVIATQMAIDDFDAKEKPAFKIEMVSADHQNKARHRRQQGARVVREGDVDVASELVTTSVALAVQKIAKEKNRVALISGAASTPITNEDCNDVTVHWTYDTYAVANGTAKAVTKGGGKTWFFLTADYAFGHSLEKDAIEVVKANGGKVVGTVRHPFPGLGLLVLPAQGAVARARRSSAWPTPAATPSTRSSRRPSSASSPKQTARRPADVHHRRALARPEDDAGDVPDRRLLLGPERRNAGLVEALLRHDKRMPTMCRPASIRRSITT